MQCRLIAPIDHRPVHVLHEGLDVLRRRLESLLEVSTAAMGHLQSGGHGAIRLTAPSEIREVELVKRDKVARYNPVIHRENAYVVWLERGKQSVFLGIRALADRVTPENMLSRVDVFIQNLAPTASERRGFDSADQRGRSERPDGGPRAAPALGVDGATIGADLDPGAES